MGGLINTGKKRKRSISHRWFVNSFSVVAILLVLLDVGGFFLLKNYYYTAVSQYLQTEASILKGIILYYDSGQEIDYRTGLRQAVEDFDKKSHAELMAINLNGSVMLTSSGFSPRNEYDLTDYENAKKSLSGIGTNVSRMPSGEKYMAVTVILKNNTDDIGVSENNYALRILSSLTQIDKQIYSTILIIGIASLSVLLLVLLLGLYFVKSIVQPLQKVGESARKLSKGDFSSRVERTNNKDEIDELCLIFNNMADELENSELIKNTFISSVSHELRTPLTAIKGWSETLLGLRGFNDKKAEQTFDKGMHVIINETTRLTTMVEELLDFSKLQSGQLTLQKADMDLFAELGDAILIYREKALRDNINLSYQEPQGVAMIYGDKNRIRQLFINIIDNAIKYSRKNGNVIIETLLQKNSVIIKIADNGQGIKKEDLPKVKNRFYKANTTVRGSGIGLAVADEIVSRHSGEMEIESEFGVGTTVTLKFKLK